MIYESSLGRCFSAGQEVPYAVFPCANVRKVEFGVDVEIIEGFQTKLGQEVCAVFPLSGRLTYTILLVNQEFWSEPAPLPRCAIIVYGCTEESIIGCTVEENNQVKTRQAQAKDFVHCVIFSVSKQELPNWKTSNSYQVKYRPSS